MRRSNKTVICKEQSGIALENWLSGRFSYLTLEQWQSEIQAGRVLLQEQKPMGSEILNQGDIVEYFPIERAEPPVELSYEIVYEDADLLIVNKPGNLPCHPGGRFFNHTLWALLKQTYPQFHIINRLDRETSGLVIIALHKKAAANLSNQIKNRTVEKMYQVLVHGKTEPSINAEGWLSNDESSEIRKKRVFTFEEPQSEEKIQSSSTWFETLSQNESFSLLKVKLGTGRMHQIRATIFSLGFPVVGDKIYGLDDQFYLRYIHGELTKQDHNDLILDRQALHACGLKFSHPTSNQSVEFEAPVPKEFKATLL